MGMWRGLASPADGSGTPVDPGRSPGHLRTPTVPLGRPEGTGRARAYSVRGSAAGSADGRPGTAARGNYTTDRRKRR
eukprot:scaffold23477_cov60-Phaeocystis_antarctica.AAC.4